jgi:6-phosphogluconolactonase
MHDDTAHEDNANGTATTIEADAGSYRLFAYPDAGTWAGACAEAIVSALLRDLQSHSRARLLVSGGGTPAPVYRALSKAPLEWARVDVALVDERWLPPDDPDSNARLVRENLLTDLAAAAHFEAMTRPGRSIEDAVATANACARPPASVVVLGMGEDGHTASLFPNMQHLDRALASQQPYVAVDAHGCPGAQQWQHRISLTPAGWGDAQCRMLLLRGERKRETFEQAVASGDVCQWPVLAALASASGSPLQVHWCA